MINSSHLVYIDADMLECLPEGETAWKCPIHGEQKISGLTIAHSDKTVYRCLACILALPAMEPIDV